MNKVYYSETCRQIRTLICTCAFSIHLQDKLQVSLIACGLVYEVVLAKVVKVANMS